MMWELNGGQPPPLMYAIGMQTLDGMKVVRATFEDGTAGMPPRRVLENDDEGAASTNGTCISHPVFFDGMGEPTIDDRSYIDEDGWMQTSTGDTEMDRWMRAWRTDDPVLFWVPPANRGRFWWPRIIAVTDTDFGEGVPVTRIAFSHFMHGENWQPCRRSRSQETRSGT